MVAEEIEASEHDRSVTHRVTVTTLSSTMSLMEHYRETRSDLAKFGLSYPSTATDTEFARPADAQSGTSIDEAKRRGHLTENDYQ